MNDTESRNFKLYLRWKAIDEISLNGALFSLAAMLLFIAIDHGVLVWSAAAVSALWVAFGIFATRRRSRYFMLWLEREFLE